MAMATGSDLKKVFLALIVGLFLYLGASLIIENHAGSSYGYVFYETLVNKGYSFVDKVRPNVNQNDAQNGTNLTDVFYFKEFKGQTDVNCAALFRNDTVEQLRSKNTRKESRNAPLPQFFINMTANCADFISQRRYITSTLTKEEKDFPIAYSIVMYKDVAQCERLLRAIYRPQHIYCIHIDLKSDPLIYEAMRRIATCFDNVFISSKRVDVKWGGYTVLEADLICMRELWNTSVNWKYLINLTGQEFPLRTNRQLVQVLTAYKGANDISGGKKRVNKDRWQHVLPAPHNLTMVKGAVHVILSRGFVDFMLHDQRSLDFLEWTKKTKHPDEHYFNTLNHNPFLGVPGSYLGEAETGDPSNDKPFVARYKVWYDKSRCKGFFNRAICIFSSGDLPVLARRQELFANKFFWNYEHALDCMEELIFNRTRDEYMGKMSFNATWYSTLDFVKHRVH